MTATPTTIAAATPFTYSGSELDALADAEHYYRAILRYFAPRLGARTVEVGAGIGTFAEHLLRQPAVERLVLVEPAQNNVPALRQRFADAGRVRVVHGYLEDMADTLTADSIVAVNVLEHVADDARFLLAARRALSPGGALLLFVPALEWLRGALDDAFEHYRRYDKPSLAAKLDAAGFRVERLRYFNAPGVVPWWVAGKVLRRTTLDPRAVRLYDRLVVPWLSALEARWEPPFGQSILAVATPDAPEAQ